MLKKIFTREVKIGLSFCAALFILIVGINYLKGINIFTPKNHYYVQYENLDGLVVSNSVMIKGYKVGQVRDIQYDFNKEIPFTVHITINDDIYLPLTSEAVMFDDGIMGGKAIELVFANESELHTTGDTLIGAVRPGLFAALGDIVPQVMTTFEKVDSVLESVNNLINSEDISATLASIKAITHDFESSSKQKNKVMNNQIPAIMDNVAVITDKLEKVSVELGEIGYKGIAGELSSTVENLKEFTEKLNRKDNSIGLLMNDKAIYEGLDSTVNSLNQLMIDIKANPKRYVHFSVFGQKEKK